MDAVRDFFIHLFYKFRKTGKLFFEHYKSNWVRFILEELGIGICFATGRIFVTRLDFDLYTLILSSLAGMGIWICVLILLSFMQAPSSLYFEQRKIANKSTWDDIEVKMHNIKDGDLRGPGLEIISHTPFNTILDVPVLEELFEERKHLSQVGSKRFNLWWYSSNGQRSSSTVRLNENLPQCVAIGDHYDGKAFLYVVDKPNQIDLKQEKQYHLKIRLRGETDGCFLPLRDISVIVEYINGKLNIKIVKDEILKYKPKERIEQDEKEIQKTN